MKKVHEFLCNMITELEIQLERNSCPWVGKLLQSKLEEVWEMRMIVSQSIDWDDNDEE